MASKDGRFLVNFVLVADGLHNMIAKCREECLINSLGYRDNVTVVINLHYVDNTLISGKDGLSQAMVLKWILLCYEK